MTPTFKPQSELQCDHNVLSLTLERLMECVTLSKQSFAFATRRDASAAKFTLNETNSVREIVETKPKPNSSEYYYYAEKV